MSFAEARRCVLEQAGAARPAPGVEEVDIDDACGRVLAQDIAADRDFPAADRAIRDGFAVRAADLPGSLRVVGEVRAGARFEAAVGQGEAVEITTGALMPAGTDAVLMVETVTRHDAAVAYGHAVEPGQFVNPQGSEARAGDTVLRAATRMDYAGVAMLASVGRLRVPVFAQPRVAIVATGDEIVEVAQTPLDFQVRNSNVYALAAQVRRAGGVPEVLGVARDNFDDTRALVDRGLAADLLLLSGGVSAGKYDIVEDVLASFGAEFFFDRVLIQPGQPLVFGRAGGKFFFGLPGNPASTIVTFELFARAAVELLAGESEPALPMPLARLTTDFQHKPGLTRFLPARLSAEAAEVTPVPWRGSGDVPALVRANAFLVADAGRAAWACGELMPVLRK